MLRPPGAGRARPSSRRAVALFEPRALRLTQPRRRTLDLALEFIEADALIEVTPEGIRLCERHLNEVDRQRASRTAQQGANLRSAAALEGFVTAWASPSRAGAPPDTERGVRTHHTTIPGNPT